MRAFILLAVCVLFADTSRAAEPDPAPAGSQSRLERLRAAAEHLKAVGRTAEAAQITTEAQRIQKEIKDALTEKRQQAEVLLEEIRKLETELGQAKTIQVKVLALEFDPAAVPELRQAVGIQEGAPFDTLTTKQRHIIDRLVKRFEADKKVKVLADTALVTNDGRPATMVAGGEFPVVTPGKGDAPTISYRNFGTRLETLPTMINADRLRLDIAYEESKRDASSAISLNGQIVPGVNLRSVNTQVEMNLGETIVCGGFQLARQQQAASPFEQVRRAASSAIELASGEVVKGGEVKTDDCVYLVLVTPEAIPPVTARAATK